MLRFIRFFCCLSLLAGSALAQNAEVVEAENKVDAAKGAGAWSTAKVGLGLAVKDRVRTGELSRAAVRLTDLSMLRLDELTKIEILPPTRETAKPTLDLSNGAVYFFSREKPRELEIRTPAATGGLRGTEFHVRVAANGRTQVTMFDGEVELANAQGRLLLRSGEQGEVEVGKAPHRTAMIEAVNIIQWCLYYPGVLDEKELALTPEDERLLHDSLEAYRAGDLLGALEKHPRGGRGSTGAQLYRAAVLLAVGQVNQAHTALARVPAAHPGRRALEEMIAAVKFQAYARDRPATTAGEWMAESYYQQSRAHLEEALTAARHAAELSPELGFAWARVAELEFSFGKTPRALQDVERALELGTRNAQAHALQGFLLAAENRIGAAERSFDRALALDGALGNAWLGRGLTFMRRGRETEGRQDLQTAAVLEPNRSILRSYLGKAFSQVGVEQKAHAEFQRARELDPHDPTPLLYSALQNKQENRYNEAVRDLEKSLTLNENRRVYRSSFLLDQDRGVRSSNLASIYQNDGMDDLAVREATRAVNSDYGSAAAHLFLANAFNKLRDPKRILLRYETPWFSELLISNLLSPVGGGPLSQFVSEQEYSKLFESDRLGLSTTSEYYGYGEFRETASQFGVYRNIAYSLDTEYQYFDYLRPNYHISRSENYGQFKFQLGPQDTLFFQTKYQDVRNGDVFQRYDPYEVGRKIVLRNPDGTKTTRENVAAETQDFHEKQEPGLLLLGLHHEWSPGNHTLLLLGRLANEQSLANDATSQTIVTRDVTAEAPLDIAANDPKALRDLRRRGQVLGLGSLGLDSALVSDFKIYSAELNQILTLGPQTFVLGGRYQSGEFNTFHRFSFVDSAQRTFLQPFFLDPPEKQQFAVNFERESAYLYDFFHVTRWLSLTGGVTYDRLTYPDNFRNPPINDREKGIEQFSPKAGFTFQPVASFILRGSYTKAISGASFDETIRLEPTQIDGFNQASRTLISENIVGSVAGARYETFGLSAEQKLPTATYLGAQLEVIEQDLDRSVGVFDDLFTVSPSLREGVLPSDVNQSLSYREDIVTGTINQLLGDRWSLGARYRLAKARLATSIDDFQQAADTLERQAGRTADAATQSRIATLRNASAQRTSSVLHELSLFALYNHPSGFFARAEANWFNQDNDGFRATAFAEHPQNDPRPGDDFWQFNLYAGWRFLRNQCEVSLGVLNLTGSDYQLEPLNYYADLPRERTFFARLRLSF